MHACSYGYDPLGLGKDPEQVAKYRENELLHARWAMLAAAGIIIPEGLQVSRIASCGRAACTAVDKMKGRKQWHVDRGWARELSYVNQGLAHED